MSSSRKTSKSSLFLMELIIAIAFFAVASAICVQLFAKAHSLSGKSNSTNMAISIAQNTAETFKQTDADLTKMSAYLQDYPLADGNNTLYYDSDWRLLINDQHSRYTMEIDIQTTENPATITIVVSDLLGEGTVLHKITAQKYIPQS